MQFKQLVLIILLLYFPLRWFFAMGMRLSIEDRKEWRRVKNVFIGLTFLVIYSLFLMEKSPEMVVGKFVSSLVVSVLIIIFLSKQVDEATDVWLRGFLITILLFLFFLPLIPAGANLRYRYINVALREEFFKFGGIFLLFLAKWIKNPRLAIIGGASIGGLFGSLENYFYGERFGFEVFAVRNLLPTHLVISALMGYLFYRSVAGKGVKRWSYLFLSLFIPVFLHWAYDFSLQFSSSVLTYIALDLLLLFFLYQKIKKNRRKSLNS